jgi:DnaA family protein
MDHMTQQLTLNVATPDGLRFESFYTTRNNADAVRLLNDLAIQPIVHNISPETIRQVFVWGEAQTGKSHLLQACCYRAAQNGQHVAYLPLQTLHVHGPEVVASLANADLIAIDDIDVVLRGDEASQVWENLFFQLLVKVQRGRQKLLVTAKCSPYFIVCRLAGLPERFLAGAHCHLQQLSDAEMFAALQMRARQRGFELHSRVIDYLQHYYPANLIDLMHLLDELDRQSLSAKKKISLAFAKKVIATMGITLKRKKRQKNVSNTE